MYNQIEDILLNISIVIATVWIVKRFWGSFFEEKQNRLNWNPSFQFASLSSDLANRLHK